MKIQFQCECGKRLQVSANAKGKWITCPNCSAALQVPDAPVAPRRAAASFPAPATPPQQTFAPRPLASSYIPPAYQPPRQPAPSIWPLVRISSAVLGIGLLVCAAVWMVALLPLLGGAGERLGFITDKQAAKPDANVPQAAPLGSDSSGRASYSEGLAPSAATSSPSGTAPPVDGLAGASVYKSTDSGLLDIENDPHIPKPRIPQPKVPDPADAAAYGYPPNSASPKASPRNETLIRLHLISGKNFNAKAIVDALAQKLGITNVRIMQRDNNATVFLGYAGTFEQFEQAIDFGTIDSIDRQARFIRVVISD